ncbi:uncharacterized protein EDB91DRAFT_1085649 [Suillus paluster]|uniref:uncharacterized protein n=1 Tax=Suillus paluster TaxID=48578 RepID=UPI001B879505|nr:uncharacterized protein EDB91DRAFT_1085649 [Suillus paluster]KAG1729878.1 hypothetical protein EDB91DRAFT_1085649 [Suillus paluster]
MHSSKDQLQILLSRTPIIAEGSQLIPCLARYFGDMYGKNVFEALCQPPPPQVCVFDPVDVPKIRCTFRLYTWSTFEGASVDKLLLTSEDLQWSCCSHSQLKEGMIVELEVILKLWTIKPRRDNPNPHDVNGSCIYQIMLQHMQLLPCTKYTQPVFVDSLKDRKGKRKAADETTGQSPTKKGSFTGVPDEDELEYTMVE